MPKSDGWRPSFSAGLLAGEAVALLLVGLLLANRALALKIQEDALSFMPAGPRLALFAALWGGLVGAASHWLGEDGHGRSIAGALWMIPLLGIHLQALLPTARGLLRLAALALPADVQGAPGLADPTRGLMIFTVPTVITLMAWGMWRTWLYFFDRFYQQEAGKPPFPPEEIDEPSPMEQHLLYRFYRTGFFLVVLSLILLIRRAGRG
ncbi:MAG: hypothetical protein GX980_09705 [Firmicutes bacterium]|jgi:hypothetical protein|nr:hypothetical protein [Bacillota bacterium]